MADFINLSRLRTAMEAVKAYTDATFAKESHDHSALYYSKLEVDNYLDPIRDDILNKADKNHSHSTDHIALLTGYEKPSEGGPITAKDTLNIALGKLEKGLEDIGGYHDHNELYLGKTETAVAAKKLDTAITITMGGAVTGSTSFDGSSDVTISTTIDNLSSDKVGSMTGYTKPETTSAITERDTLNIALGKLETALDGKQAIGDYAAKDHNHDDVYYTKNQVDDLINGSSSDTGAVLEAAKKYTDDKIENLVGTAPEALDTLQELSKALGDDANFAATVTTNLSKKADKDHTHDNATETSAGFMSAEDKSKLLKIENEANNYIHPDTPGNKHIPAGGQPGLVLTWAADGVAVWATIPTQENTDTKVTNTLNDSTKAYITGTISSSTNTGEQIFDTGVFLSENPGELVANKFVGNLNGTAATAEVAEKTRKVLTINLGYSNSIVFDGSEEQTVNIDAESIGAVSTTDFINATTQATDTQVTNVLNSIFNKTN